MANIKHTSKIWQKHIDEQSGSGLTINEYCKKHQVSISSFYQWRKKLKSPSSQQETSDWLVLPAKGTATNNTDKAEEHWQIELALPGGITLRMTSAH